MQRAECVIGSRIERIEMDLVAWLEQHQRKSCAEIKGIMSRRNCPDPSASERAQYVRGTFQLAFSLPNAAFRRCWRRIASPSRGEVGVARSVRLRPLASFLHLFPPEQGRGGQPKRVSDDFQKVCCCQLY